MGIDMAMDNLLERSHKLRRWGAWTLAQAMRAKSKTWPTFEEAGAFVRAGTEAANKIGDEFEQLAAQSCPDDAQRAAFYVWLHAMERAYISAIVTRAKLILEDA